MSEKSEEENDREVIIDGIFYFGLIKAHVILKHNLVWKYWKEIIYSVAGQI